jgi:hypothetical protein
LETEAAKQLDAAAEKCDHQLEVAGKNAEAVKKVAAGKRNNQKQRQLARTRGRRPSSLKMSMRGVMNMRNG